MAFDAEQRKISDILSGDYKFVVPRYQRKYVWQEKQWRELLDDIKYCLKADEEERKKLPVANENKQEIEWTHFLGSFVFERKKNDLVKNDLIVIDGQQRLTTITVMLCAICTLFNEHGEENRFRGVKKYIIGTDDMGIDYVRVDNQDLSNFRFIVAESTTYRPMSSKKSLFSGAYLEKSPEDNVNVKGCFHFFYAQFSEMIQGCTDPIAELARIKDKIIGLDVIDIRATNERESYNIFEILNARGVDLKQHELIKNYIFKYISPIAQIDTAKLKWDSMERKLYIKKRSTLDSFFSHYVSHRYDKPNKDDTEFRIIKANCDRLEMSAFLDDLSDKASYYRMFLCPEECENRKISEVLKFFLDNNHRQFRPLFLSVFSAYKRGSISEKKAEQFFEAIRNFYIGFGIVCGGKSNTIEDKVYEYARKIENEDASTHIQELLEKLHEYYPSSSDFESHFILLGWSHKAKNYRTPAKKRQVQYILAGIENHYLSSNNELSINKFSIEHIANDNGNDWHCRIGNLLMLSEPINGNAADKSFTEKIAFYKQSDFVSTRRFVERNGAKSEWLENNIKERGVHMARLAYNEIWKFL